MITRNSGGTGCKFPFKKGRSMLVALKYPSYLLKNSCTEAQGPFDQSVGDGRIPPLQGAKPSDSLQKTVIDDSNVELWSLVQERLEKLELEVKILQQTIRVGEKGKDADEDNKMEVSAREADRKHNDNVFTVTTPKPLQSHKTELSKRQMELKTAKRKTWLMIREERKALSNDLSPTAKSKAPYKVSKKEGKNDKSEKVKEWHIPKLGQERKAGK